MASSAFPDESRVREVVEQIRARCALAQQLKHSGQHTTPSSNLQFAQAEEIQKRLNETIFRLQEAVRDFSLGGIENRLRRIAQKLSLSFDRQVNSFFLSCDAFFVEINSHENGKVTAVKLVQGHNQQEESELFAHLLQEHQYAEFESHLRELIELYSHAGQDKINFFLALSAMEKVLEKISESHPMRLAYFVDPYEVHRLPVLRSVERDATPPDGVAETGSILMEKTTQQRAYRLPIENIFNPALANFFSLTAQNSAALAVTFNFVLSRPIPISAAVKEKLFRIADQPIQPVTGPHVNELIAGKKAEKLLPGQRHYYFLQSPSSSSSPSHSTSPEHINPSERGDMISNVRFTHPVQIFTIILLLRKQLMYNTLLASCLKQNSKSSTPPDHSVSEYIFHITTTPPDQIMVSMETLNGKEQQLTFVIVIPDQPHPTQPLVKVSVSRVGGGQTTTSLPQLSQIFLRCLSIPVLLWSCLKHPSTLGEEAAIILQSYEKEMVEFKKEVMAGGEPVEEEGLESMVGGEMIDLVIPVDGDNDGTSVVEELVYAGMKRKWTE